MTLEELRNEWKLAAGKGPSEDELRRMMYRPRFWIFEGLTPRDILEFCAKLTGFTVIMILTETLDGWFWSLVGTCGLLNLFDEHFGLRYLRSFPVEDTMLKSIAKGIRRVKRIMIITRTLYVLIELILASWVGFELLNGNELAIPVAVLLIPGLTYFNWHASGMWTEKIKELRELEKRYKSDNTDEEEDANV